MWHALLAGDEATLPQYLDEWMTNSGYAPPAHPAVQLLADEAGRHTFALLNEAIQTALLASFLNDACYRLSDCSALYQYACIFSDARSTTPPALREPLALQALWRDDQDRLDQIAGEGELPPTVTGWMALCRGQKDAALEAYRQLVSQYRKATRKRKLHLPPLPALVGHPAVFWQDAPDVRIDIEPGQVTLVITEAGEHLALTLRPPGISDSRGLLWEKETPTRLVVYPVSDEHRKIAGILGRELRIPAGARDRVLQSVSSIAPLLPVQA
ncbi:hypothetical protein BSQ98_10160 [Serratia liquefaciens]|uniref:hypothetical protein n=1 Tax=Serratia liquefaciens TaxID=614 RepID=UPI0010DE89B5|nr:hypothetical protein [Serratia liquefaciens]RYM64419.1 hypothetical protein BSQ98_10160 [Serratia liquefaciens]